MAREKPSGGANSTAYVLFTGRAIGWREFRRLAIRRSYAGCINTAVGQRHIDDN